MPQVKETFNTESDLNSTRNFIYSNNEIFNTFNCSTTGHLLEKPTKNALDKNEKNKTEIDLGVFDKKEDKSNNVTSNKQLCMNNANSSNLCIEKQIDLTKISKERLIKANDTRFTSLIHKCAF